MRSSDSRITHPLSWRSRAFRAVLTLILLMLALRLAWGWYTDRLLGAQLNEARRRGQPVVAEDIVFEAVPDSENAFLLQLRAAQSHVAGVDSPRNSSDQYAHDYPPFPANWMKRARASEQAHGKVFALARQARQLTRVQTHDGPPAALTPSSIGYMSDLRHLVRTLNDGAEYSHVTGDDAEAIERVFDTLHVARSLRHDPYLLSQLIAMGIDAAACDVVQTIAPGLHTRSDDAIHPATRRQIQLLIAELLDDREAWTGFQLSLVVERVWTADNRRDTTGRVWLIRPLATMDAVRFNANLDLTIEASHAPNKVEVRNVLAGRQLESPIRDAFTLADSPSQDPRYSRWFSMWPGDYSRAFETHFRVLAERRVTAVALAIQLFRADHDRFPANPRELVPEYLRQVPADPFLDNKPLGYQIFKNGLPDGRDRPMLFFEAGVGFAREPMKRPIYSFWQDPSPADFRPMPGDYRPRRQYRDVTRFEPSSP